MDPEHNPYCRVERLPRETPENLVARAVMDDSALVHGYQMEVWRLVERRGVGVSSASPGHLVVRPLREDEKPGKCVVS